MGTPSDVFPVVLNAVSKAYGSGKLAVRDLTLSLRGGEIVGLLGPNGAGKTTTLKLLATVLRPSAGRVLYGSAAVDPWNAAERDRLNVKRGLGWLPERPLLYDLLTAQEYLRFLGRLLEIPKSDLEGRISYLLELLDLTSAGDDFIKTYSYGMQRKVSLAGCRLNDPKLLLLDEPTAGIDPQGVREIKDLLAALKSEGRGILVSTHILDVAEKLCDRVAIIDKGTLVFAGHVNELRSRLKAPGDASL
ncbi:MAG TPA: ABC transporter ATP-binding protein, partial [Bryobacteraceae bacterium]|nr:ABC transporter ATP-binding protein [Bryobacteraceae bacterium]